VVSVGDHFDVLVGQFTVDEVNYFAHLAGVYKERFASPVAETAILLITCQEPQAGRELSPVEELAAVLFPWFDGWVDHVGLDLEFFLVSPARWGSSWTNGNKGGNKIISPSPTDDTLWNGTEWCQARSRVLENCVWWQ